MYIPPSPNGTATCTTDRTADAAPRPSSAKTTDASNRSINSRFFVSWNRSFMDLARI